MKPQDLFTGAVSTLFDTAQDKLLYIVKATSLSVTAAFLVSLLIYLIYPTAEKPVFDGSFIWLLFIAVILGPLIETLMLWAGIFVISKFLCSTWHIALISALCWALLHSLQVATWGLSIFWSFVVFSIAFVEWSKVSKSEAFIVTAAIHMLQNLLVICFIHLV